VAIPVLRKPIHLRGHNPTPSSVVERDRTTCACFSVRDQDMAALPLERQDFHGDWNYTLHPTDTL